MPRIVLEESCYIEVYIQMNNYPQWWDSTLTIYNKYINQETQVVEWYKTVVYNCFWKYAGNKISIGETVLETNDIVARIPKSGNYVEPYEWVDLPVTDKEDYFTLGVGDIIVKGEIEEEINEYIKGKRSSDFISKYKSLQGCMEIQRVAINVGVGRCNEHYYVKGI